VKREGGQRKRKKDGEGEWVDRGGEKGRRTKKEEEGWRGGGGEVR